MQEKINLGDTKSLTSEHTDMERGGAGNKHNITRIEKICDRLYRYCCIQVF